MAVKPSSANRPSGPGRDVPDFIADVPDDARAVLNENGWDDEQINTFASFFYWMYGFEMTEDDWQELQDVTYQDAPVTPSPYGNIAPVLTVVNNIKRGQGLAALGPAWAMHLQNIGKPASLIQWATSSENMKSLIDEWLQRVADGELPQDFEPLAFLMLKESTLASDAVRMMGYDTEGAWKRWLNAIKGYIEPTLFAALEKQPNLKETLIDDFIHFGDYEPTYDGGFFEWLRDYVNGASIRGIIALEDAKGEEKQAEQAEARRRAETPTAQVEAEFDKWVRDLQAEGVAQGVLRSVENEHDNLLSLWIRTAPETPLTAFLNGLVRAPDIEGLPITSQVQTMLGGLDLMLRALSPAPDQEPQTWDTRRALAFNQWLAYMQIARVPEAQIQWAQDNQGRLMAEWQKQAPNASFGAWLNSAGTRQLPVWFEDATQPPADRIAESFSEYVQDKALLTTTASPEYRDYLEGIQDEAGTAYTTAYTTARKRGAPLPDASQFIQQYVQRVLSEPEWTQQMDQSAPPSPTAASVRRQAVNAGTILDWWQKSYNALGDTTREGAPAPTEEDVREYLAGTKPWPTYAGTKEVFERATVGVTEMAGLLPVFRLSKGFLDDFGLRKTADDYFTKLFSSEEAPDFLQVVNDELDTILSSIERQLKEPAGGAMEAGYKATEAGAAEGRLAAGTTGEAARGQVLSSYINPTTFTQALEQEVGKRRETARQKRLAYKANQPVPAVSYATGAY